MALSNENGSNGMVMPVVPYGNNSGSSWGNGFSGDGAWWLLVLFLFMFNGNGWGNGWNNGGGAIPYMMNNATNNDVQRGFDQQAIMNGINSLTGSVSNGFANAEISRCNSQANILQTLNANQNSINNAMNQIGMSLQNCCCENRAGLADLKYTVATEACADRAAVSNALRDVIDSNNANTQAILDKMCQQEIDALKTQNANLQTQINLANLQASQAGQTSVLLQDNSAQTQALKQYLNPAPVPAYIVQNPNRFNPQPTACCCGG